jgi:assimilatory nitrate reductase catalytic subunit
VAEVPVDPRRIIERFGPHLSSMTGVQLSTSAEPDRLVKTHCCFCGQQCGIQLKVRDNQVIGFEPWEDFPFNRGMLCPKGVKRYLQGSHPDRLTFAATRRRPPASARCRTARPLPAWPAKSRAFSRHMAPERLVCWAAPA